MQDRETAILTLSSGFSFDYTNIYGCGGIREADISALRDRIRAAHSAVEEIRKTGRAKGHMSKDGLPEKVRFTQLPYIAEGMINTPASLARIKAWGGAVREREDAVVFFGIGGSYLGNKVLFDIHCGEYWNTGTPEQREGGPKIFFSGNNMDPRRTMDLIRQLQNDAQLKERDYRVTMVVISKSGSTIDTMSTFMIVYDALRKNKGINISAAAVTDLSDKGKSLLRQVAEDKGWPLFSVPEGVGGRFSVFSEVGLIMAACIGFDIEEFLAGARAMNEACRTDNVWKNPALLNAVLKYIAYVKYGRNMEVFMPYADDLKSMAEWYVQLLAESLGKRFDREGREVFYGRTPIVAVGTTDMHAQTQQHQDGQRDKVVQFVKVRQWDEDPFIPPVFTDIPYFKNIADIRLSKALEAARKANAEALIEDHRFNATFELPRLSAFHAGELMFMLALSIAYEGELADVNAYDQPGVEDYKRIMGQELSCNTKREELASRKEALTF
jgi:glucose-6-phosphate isomerase